MNKLRAFSFWLVMGGLVFVAAYADFTIWRMIHPGVAWWLFFLDGK